MSKSSIGALLIGTILAAPVLPTASAEVARRPDVAGFDEILRWGQNTFVAQARQARADLDHNAR